MPPDSLHMCVYRACPGSIFATLRDELIKHRKDVTLSLGDGRKSVESQLALGLLALHNGLDLDLDGYRQFIQVMSDDHGDAANAIQEAFIDAARAAGVPFGSE